MSNRPGVPWDRTAFWNDAATIPRPALNVASPVRATNWRAFNWLTPVLTSAPFPPTPVPETPITSAPRLRVFTAWVPATSRVAPGWTRVPAVAPPRAALFATTSRPTATLTGPVNVFAPDRTRVPA